MQGQVHWLPVAIVMLGVVAVTLFAWIAVHWRQRFSFRNATVQCPGTGEAADVVLEADGDTGKRDIVRCTALHDPDHVDCHRECMKQLGPK